MIRQICLSCYKTVELPDDTAGKETPCPNCGKAIAVPAKYSADVAAGGGVPPPPVPPPTPSLPPLPPPPPPGPRSGAPPMTEPPAAPPGLKTEAVPPAPPPPAEGPTRGFGCSLNPIWLDWVPVGCLLLAFILSFLPWASMTLGGYTVMTQNGWETVFASKGDANLPRGEVWDEVDKVLSGKTDKDKYKPAVLRTDWLVLLYLLLLLGTVVLFAAERLVQDPAKFAPLAGQKWLPPIWKWRLAALGGLAVLAFAILWFQAIQGFSLQRAVTTFIMADYKDKLAENPSDAEKRETWIKIGQAQGFLPVTQTFWLKLLLVLHAVAVVAVAGRFWLDMRGNKPLPRADVRW